MRTIILAGYRQADAESCPWLVPAEGKTTLLEKQIQLARIITPRPVVVLAGALADEALRRCRSLEACELVFDTYDNASTLLTNLRSALYLGMEPAIVLPAEWSFGDLQILQYMTNAVIRDGLKAPYHILQGMDENGQLYNQGLPIIITYRGCEEVMRNKNLTGLADSALQYASIAVAPAQPLASAGDHL